MPKIQLTGFILVDDKDMPAIVNELDRHIALTRQEVGCLMFDVEQDAKNKNKFHVKEEFINREAFEYHQKRVAASNWGKVSVNVERHYQICEVDDK